MNSFRLLRSIAGGILLLVMFPLKNFSQNSSIDLFLTANMPGFLYLGNISKYAKNPIGFSIASKIFLTKKLAITPSIGYDNFNYKPVDKRIADYATYKMGVIYFDNLVGDKFSKLFHDSTIKSYSVVDGGLGVKLNDEMIGNKNCSSYSIGYGIRFCRKRMAFDGCHRWSNLKLANGITASWIEYRFGFGYRLNK